MNVLFISRSTLFTTPGGDTIQIKKTAEYLILQGISVDIRLCTDKIDYTAYDLIHFFNIIRPADILQHILDSGKPYVVSTIYVDYAEFERRGRQGGMKWLFSLFSSDMVDYLKVVGRRLINGEKIVSPIYLRWGQRRSIRYIAQHAECLLPNSVSEYRRLAKQYALDVPYHPIPNAIDPALFQTPSDAPRDEKMVLCVGRIEGRKNQLRLIQALNGTDFTCYIIGAPSSNHLQYYEECRRIAGSNVRFIDNIDQEQLLQYYTRAKVHILPSWFETTGLSTLEAAAMGCNIVITDKGDTREYFEDYAWYCDPASAESILAAIRAASESPVRQALIEKIYAQYTWANAARLTKAAYEETVSATSSAH